MILKFRPRNATRSGNLGLTTAAIITAVLLAGCTAFSDSSDDEEPQSLAQIAQRARDSGHSWAAEQLEDGDITLAEYDEGHRRNLECLTSGGLTYTEPERIIVDGFRWDYLITWQDVGEEKGMRVMEECFEEFVSDLELAMNHWGSWNTDPAVLAEIKVCVQDLGFKIDETSNNYREIWLSASDQGLTQEVTANCVRNAMSRLHPSLPSTVAF